MVLEDVVSLNSSSDAEKKLACEKKLVIASEVPLRNKALNYRTRISASRVPGCCGVWEAQRSARAGKVKLGRAVQGVSCWLGVVMWLDTCGSSFLCMTKGMVLC